MSLPRIFLTHLLTAVLGLALLTSCDSSSTTEDAAPSEEGGDASASPATGAESATTVYRVRGLVRKVADDDSMAVIDHEEIPGYMEAMSMPFYPREPSVFADLEAGQNVEFDYHVEGDQAWVENVSVLPKSAVQIATEEKKE